MRRVRVGAMGLLLLFAARPAAAQLTFFTCSDTHYNEAAVSNTAQAALIDLMNALPGKAYPPELGGGPVAVPRGVIIPGDLIDDGQGPVAMIRDEWALWKADFGLHGEGRLKFPVYEGYGNHDLNDGLFIENEIKARTAARSNVVAVATNGLHYAWEWDGIHFVQLNLYPGTVRPPGVQGQPPRQALEFLKEDLAKNVGRSGRPVVVSHHYMPADTWWTDAEKEAYHAELRDYNVILIVHGHQGRASLDPWKGITTVDNHAFLGAGVFVVRIEGDEMSIVQRRPDDTWGMSLKKRIQRPGAPPAPAP